MHINCLDSTTKCNLPLHFAVETKRLTDDCLRPRADIRIYVMSFRVREPSFHAGLSVFRSVRAEVVATSQQYILAHVHHRTEVLKHVLILPLVPGERPRRVQLVPIFYQGD